MKIIAIDGPSGSGKGTIAKEVATGIDGLQDRLDDAVQRSGRIANIIADIEAKNRP